MKFLWFFAINLTILSFYHKNLAKEFEREFDCLGENTE